tara:strand:+ start:192 stop:614 length:423 start_codon:yes stop_codon:yes gene_type:complete
MSISSNSSDSESDVETDTLEKTLKDTVPKQEVVVKPKRTYTKKPMTDEAKAVLVERLAKAREARAVSQASKKQASAQENAELKQIKKMKDAGEVIMKPKKERKPREKKIVEVHHHYSAPPPEPKAPKKVKAVAQPAMVFA